MVAGVVSAESGCAIGQSAIAPADEAEALSRCTLPGLSRACSASMVPIDAPADRKADCTHSDTPHPIARISPNRKRTGQ